MNVKKIILIIIFLLTIVIIGFFIYTAFFKQTIITTKPNEKIATTTTTTSGGLPTAGEGGAQIVEEGGEGLALEKEITTKNKPDEKALGGVTKTTAINESPSLAPTVSNNGKDVQYYNKDDGKFYKIDDDGNIKTLSDKVFHDIEKITWSPKKSKAILEYPDGANIIYDFDTKKQITLPKHWEEFDFSNNGNQIVMKSIGLDPENKWLAIANDDGSRSRPIERIGENADSVYPSWSPNNQSIAMYTKGVDFNRQKIYFVGLNDENFKSTTVEGRGFQHIWSTKGDKLLYSVYSSDTELKPKLWIVNAEGEQIGSNRKSLDIETWAEKCVFTDNRNLYCAVPKNLEKGSGLFPEMAKNTNDNLYKIDINTGQKQLIAIPDGDYNMSDLMLTNNGENIFFTNSKTGLIHKIELR